MKYDTLKGKLVEFSHPKTGGTHYGLVRSVDGGPRTGLRSVLVTGPSNPDGKTLSTRYSGPRVRVTAEALHGVRWRGKMVKIPDFLCSQEPAQEQL